MTTDPSRPHGGSEGAVFSRLATFLHANARRVLAVAVLATTVAGAFGFGVAKEMSPYGADDPATQSVRANHRFEDAAGRQIDAGVVAIVQAGDVRGTAAKVRVDQGGAQLRAHPAVARVVTYYDMRDAAMISRDGRSTYVLAYFKPLSDKTLEDAAKGIETSFSRQRDVKLGGEASANAQVNSQVGEDLGRAELLAFPFIFLLSLLFFRSLVAALLPPLLGGLAIVATFFALRIVASFADLSVFALNLVTGLGLGLAIDYSLFMVSRYREEAATTGFGLDTLRRTLQTAGRTILFSAVTVAVAVASLAIFPQRFLYSMGIAGAVVALVAAFLALVVLPALLTVLGPRVNALAPKRLQRAADRDARPASSGGWYRLARYVMRRPARVAALSAALLIALGLPFTGIRFTSVDATVLPKDSPAHLVDTALRSEFPPGRTTPVVVAAHAPPGPQVRRFARRVRGIDGVAALAPPRAQGDGLTRIDVFTRGSDLSEQ